jgi:hypothetical protein
MHVLADSLAGAQVRSSKARPDPEKEATQMFATSNPDKNMV